MSVCYVWAHGGLTCPIFNLVQLSCILSVVFAICTFCVTESTKELGTREKSSQAPLRWIFQRCPLDKLLMLAAKAQTSLAFARLHVTFRPWRGITFAMNRRVE